MRTPRLADMSVAQLVELFAAIALDQSAALWKGDTSKYNRLYDRLVAVRDELGSRPGDQRVALVSLLGHPNLQVRLQAALYSLAVARSAAQKTLQEIDKRNEYPQAAYARQTLEALENGTSRLV